MRVAPRRRAKGLFCIVLAAGGSARLGRPKQLLRYKARPLLARALAQAALISPGRVVVVLGAGALRLRGLLNRANGGFEAVYNARWQAGLAGSLRAGIAALPAGAEAALILLSDQPKIPDRALERLTRRWQRRRSRAVAARYGGRPGVPAIIPRRHWRKIRELEGDVGARGLLRELAEVALVELPDAAFDVDTLEDLKRL